MGDENKSNLSVALPVSMTFAGGITATVVGVSMLVMHACKDRGKRRAVLRLMALSMALCGLIGWSRIYLGVHHPSDVLAGWIAGTTWLLTCGVASKYIAKA